MSKSWSKGKSTYYSLVPPATRVYYCELSYRNSRSPEDLLKVVEDLGKEAQRVIPSLAGPHIKNNKVIFFSLYTGDIVEQHLRRKVTSEALLRVTERMVSLRG